MKIPIRSLSMLAALLFPCANGFAFLPTDRAALTNFDRRTDGVRTNNILSGGRQAAVERLRARLPQAQVEFDPAIGAPKFISAGDQFLSGANGEGNAISAAVAARFAATDPYRPTRAFLQEHRELFGHGPEVLDKARIKREFVTPHNGMRTVVWEQQVDGIPLFESVFISHTTRQGELVNLASQFVPDPEAAADRGVTHRAALVAAPEVSARQAVVIAARNIGMDLDEPALAPDADTNGGTGAGPEKPQFFKAAGFKGKAEAKLIWLPMGQDRLQLCWDVVLMSRARGEMFRVLVDVQTGEPLLRHCLTDYLSAATYRVYTSDSPSPFSPGWASPSSGQPPLTNRVLVTLSALDTNASPNGWIDDGGNETLGNNADAHTDLNADNVADLPRPQGSPFRVFDFPLDLAQSPITYTNASVVQLFYWNNFMHDKLYELGFTEAAGNFQNNNFGRGGLGNDAVQADAQDGSGVNNANFSTPPDGSPGRMQMYIFNGATPNRDGDLDAEVVLHEYTHGLSNRRVGGGVGISALQPSGMGEGWSDFYAMALLSEPGDDVNGVYASGGYVTYQLSGLTQNYYFGIRRYPYCTDLSKNPLTFKDIDPAQASSHIGVPRNPIIGTTANEVHNMGEVWCMTLREARANLINKYGWAVGNQLILQLVTDGMNLSPANPNFLQARDAILQADQVDTGGANRNELWAAFAKRGMGFSATSPASSTTTGLVEAYDVPDNLRISPAAGWNPSGPTGGPFIPTNQTYSLSDAGSSALAWVAWTTQPWVEVAPGSGSLSAGASNSVSVYLTPAANSLSVSSYVASVVFSNTVSGMSQTRAVNLTISPPRVLFFPLDTDPGWARQSPWAFGKPLGLGGASFGHPDPSTGATGTNVFGINLSGDYSTAVGGPYYLTAGPFNFAGYTGMKLRFQRWLNTDYPSYVYATIDVSTNGTSWTGVWTNTAGVTIADAAWTQVAYDISAYADNRTNVFIRWGHRVASSGAFAYSGWNLDDVEFLGAPSQKLALAIPSAATEGDGVITGTVSLSTAPASDLIVSLGSSDTTAATVPATVTIPAGQSNAVFSLTIIDDGVLDGTQTAAITASASGWGPASSNLMVFDNETATLQVLLPATATEGQGTVGGTVQVSTAVGANVSVSLSSSDTTEIQVPASVIILSGQTSAAFTATVVDDNQIDGPQNATVTAHVQNWTDGGATITVLDNESLNLTVTLPASALESTGVLANAGAVGISGTLPTNLVVSLASDAPGRLTVPLTATIPAGQQSGAFSLTLVDNSIHDGNQIVTVTASASGFINGSAPVVVVDDDLPPTIITQPTNQTVFVGGTTFFTVVANGKSPLNYQWAFKGTNIAGATGATLTLANVQLNQAGNYAVLVTNAFGSLLSSNAVLTVNLPPPCTPPPPGLAGWWRGESNANDSIFGNNGTAINTGFAAGEVGQAFSFDGASGYVSVPDSPLLDSFATNITIELWMKAGQLTANADWKGLVTKGNDSWRLMATSLDRTVYVAFSGATPSDLAGTRIVNDGQWHHVAATYDGNQMSLYVDGTLDKSQLATGPVFQNSEPLCLGADSKAYVPSCACSKLGYFFNGWVDEVSLYSRALSAAEIQAIYNAGVSGKCDANPPVILSQPTNQTALVGGNAAFGVWANGTPPLSYQWSLSGTNLSGATNTSLTLTNLQLNQAGNYAVLVTNAFGSILSSNALLVLAAHHYAWNPISSPRTTNAPIAVTLLAKDATNGTLPGYTNPVPLYGMATNQAGANLDFEAGTLSPWTPLNVGNQPGPYDLVAFDVNGDGLSSTAFRIAANSGTPDGITQNVSLTGGATYAVKMDIATDDTSSGNNADGGTTTILIGGTTVAQFSWGSVNIGNIYRTNLTGTFTPPSSGVYAVTLTFSRGYFEAGNLWCLADDLRIIGPGNPVTVLPAVTGNFTNGVWSGNVTVLNLATNVVLTADDGHGHLGVSNPFDVLPAMAPVILAQPTNRTVLGGSNVTFTVGAYGTMPLSYFWQKNTLPLAGATNASLAFASVTRTNSGTYAVMVTNLAGSIASSNAVLLVHVPQRLGMPVWLPDGTLRLTSGDMDGGPLSASDLANLQAQASSNLVNWVTLPGSLTLTNGVLRLQDPGWTNQPLRFYRIIENW